MRRHSWDAESAHPGSHMSYRDEATLRAENARLRGWLDAIEHATGGSDVMRDMATAAIDGEPVPR